MFRGLLVAGLIAFAPNMALAQQACNTSDARHVVDELYRHMLERPSDASSQGWVDKLMSGVTVREVVREIAQSPEHMQRFYKPSEGAGAYPDAIGNLYRHILGRQPDAAGVQAFTSIATRSGGLGPVVDEIVNSAEYSQSFGDWGVPGSGGLVYCGTGSGNRNGAGTGNRNGTGTGNRTGNSSYNSSAPAYGQSSDVQPMFSAMDANHDGVIQRKEWRGTASTFNMRDWNGDGVLSGDEVRSGTAAPAGSAVYNDYNLNASDRFAYLDVNHNGYIDRNEWDGSLDQFYQLDRNNDGRLSRTEYNQNGGRMTSFNTIDSNHDGRITLGEWRWSHASFDQMDANRDGVITPDEFNSGAVPTTGR